MKQGDHIVMCEKGGAITLRSGEIAREIHHGGLQGGALQAPVALTVNPGTALLALARLQIKGKVPYQLTIRMVDADTSGIRMPALKIKRFQYHAK